MADKVYRRKLTDLVPDQRNANQGTERGLRLLDDSLQEDGAGRGILLDKNNHVIAGNKTLERAVDLGYEEIIVVPTDGKQLVATQRIDVDLDTPQGRRMAIRDNRVAEIDLAWDADALKAIQDDGVDLTQFWREDELTALLGDDGGSGAGDDNYSRKIDIPIYKPSGTKPDTKELIDRTRYDALISAINSSEDLTDDERAFLTVAASRHIVFNYAKIADLYAHSDAKVQRLMEDSALVIIDFNRAIELGYTRLTQQIAELIGEENND